MLDYPFELVKIFSFDSEVMASNWSDEDELIFTVTYAVDNGPEVTEEFILKKELYTDIVWPT